MRLGHNRHPTQDELNACRCGCYGCKFHCSAHWTPWMRFIELFKRETRPL